MAKRTTSPFTLPSSPSFMRVEAAGLWQNDEIVRRCNNEDSFIGSANRGREDSSLQQCNRKMHHFDFNCNIMSSEDQQQPVQLYDDDEFRNLINSESKTNMKIMSRLREDYSHIVPDDDHDHYEVQDHHCHPSHDYYYYSQLLLEGGVGRDATAPTASEFDHHLQMKPFSDEPPYGAYNHDDDDDAVVMINSKTRNSFSVKRLPCTTDHMNSIPVTVPAAADDDDDYKHSVVPHHHHDHQPFSSHHCYCTAVTHDASKHLISSEPNPKLAVPNSTANNGNTNKEEAEAAIVPSLSVCSNDLSYPGSNAQDQDDSAYPSQSVEHEEHDPQSLGTLQTTPAKRKYIRIRTTKPQNFSQRKRRENKIKKKMCKLQQLIPNCNKVDKASILDEAIVYLKALQLQLQMMLMGTGVMPPMMIGNGTLAPHLNYMTAASAVTPTFQMLGFAPHAASFVPLVTPSLIVQHPSISLSTSMNSNPSHQPKHNQR